MEHNCKDCRFFKPKFYQVGMCIRPQTAGAKLFTDDSDADILVHVTFGCKQFEEPQRIEEGTI